MSGRDDIEQAAQQARSQIREAREALAASRTARGGGRARSAREAERQLLSLRRSVAEDAKMLRERFTGQDPAATRTLRIAALGTSGAVAGVVGAALLGRGAITRGSNRRSVQRQAVALARALSAHTLAGASSDASAAAPTRRRRSRSGAVLLVLAGAVAAGAMLAQQRQSAPPDDDDLWLPVEPAGPA